MTRRKTPGSRDGLFWNGPAEQDAPEVRPNPRPRPCPACRAVPFEPCTRPGRRGRRVRMSGYHPSRYDAPAEPDTEERT